MNSQKLIITLSIFFITFGCSPAAVTPNIQVGTTETTVTPLPAPTVTAAPSATLMPDSPAGCVNLTINSLDISRLNGLLIVFNSDGSFFLDPQSNQILNIEDKTQISEIAPDTGGSWVHVSPNKKLIMAVSDVALSKSYAVIRTADKVVKTYSTQGQEQWNRGRWLDNERMFFQDWFAPHDSSIVIYNPFTGEQKNIQLDLPNPYIVEDIGGRLSWVKADIDPTLKRVLYNDKDERLVLWNLDTQKEIASLPSPTDLLYGTWSPDGKVIAIPSTSSNSASTELFTIDMDGTVKMTDFNQKYSFANVDNWPSWSPDGRHIAYWLKISNDANADTETLGQWLAITDTTTLETQIYCLSSNKPPRSGGNIVWSPDSTQVIVTTSILGEEMESVLVDLIHLTQTKMDIHGLGVSDWMAP